MISNPRLALIGCICLAVLTLASCHCGGPRLCVTAADCGDWAVCLQTQTCAPACSGDEACASTEKCSAAGGCVGRTGCGANADCPSGQACTAGGSCVQSCQTAADCGAAGACNGIGNCVTDCRGQPCGPGQYCTPSGACIATNNPDGGAPTCGGELFEAKKVESNMLLAFDKSGSMNDQINGQSKWSIAVSAMKQVTSQYQAQIRFGLMLFPQGGNNSTQCVPAPVSVQVGSNTASQIASALDGSGPGGRTPIGGVLTSAGNVAELADPGRANYVLLVTDGQETCNGNGVQAATNNLSNKRIKTFVVGFGSEVDPNNLSEIAVAGGTARLGTPKYYQADDSASLLAAFHQIAQGALGCEYKLAQAPPDPSKIFVYVNGILQNRDANHTNGWDYAPATQRVTFYGGLCDLVAKDPSAKVSIVYGCRDDSLTEGDRRDGGAGLPGGAACNRPGDCANGICHIGTCGLPPGSSCSSDAQCSSQVCTIGKCGGGIN